MNTRNLLIALIAALAALLVWLAFFWEPVGPRPVARVQSHAPLQLATAPTGGDFALQGGQGPVRLADYRGKAVLLYFGYTYCPDVCPTSLSLLAQALSGFSADELARIQPIFISVDPERDTPARLAEYGPFFHPSIIGVTGSPEEVARVAAQYGASYARQPANADGQYAVDHSSATYVIDPRGILVDTLPHGTPPARIIEAVRPLLAAPTTPPR